MTKLKIIKIQCKKIILNSTIHGLPNALRTNNLFLKTVWFMFFLVSASVGIYSVIDSLNDYLNYEVVTKIDQIDEFPIQFPAVTFFNPPDPKDNISVKNVIISCRFNSGNCPEDDFFMITDKYGYVSYSLKKKEYFLAGKGGGLDLVLFNQKGRRVPSRRIKGIEVIVHNHSFDPMYYSGYSNDATSVSPGSGADLVINRVYSNKLGEPYNNCIKDVKSSSSFDSDLFKFMITSRNYSYRQKDCFGYCIGQELINHFNISTDVDNYDNIMLILTNQFNFSEPDLMIYLDLIKGKLNEICLPKCPLECDSVKYEISTSFSKFPSDEYANSLLNNSKIKSFFPSNYNITAKDIQDNLINFKVYYRDSKLTQITQIAKTNLFGFISNIGGIFGLFLGISFLSFVEILELIFECILICLKSER